MPLTAIRILPLAVLSFVLSRVAIAQTTGAVEVATGDRIEGDVRGLYRGELSFRTLAAATPGARRWAGTIAIVWTEVVTLTSPQPVDVELSSGERFSGPISSPSPRQLVVETATGPTKPIDMEDVIRIIPIEVGFRARATGSIDFGLNFTTANDERTYTLNGEAGHQSAGYVYETELKFSSWLSAREDVERQTRNDVSLDVRRRLANRWYALGTFGAQQDEELDLDVRILAGGGVGRKLVQSNRTILSLEGGADYDAERYAGAGSFDHSAEAFGGVSWDWFAVGSVVEAALTARGYVGLTRERFRLELDSTVRRDLAGNLYAALNVFESFDSDPPDDRERSNLGVSITFGWTF